MATREQKFIAAMIFTAMYVFLGWKFASGEDCVVTVRDGAVTVEYFQQLGKCPAKKAKDGKKAAAKKKSVAKKAVVAKKAAPAKPAVKEDGERERREKELADAFQAGTVTHEGSRQEVEERIPPPLPTPEESALGRRFLIGALSAGGAFLLAAPEPVATKVLGALLSVGAVLLAEDKTDAAVVVGAGAAGAIAGGVVRHKAAPAKSDDGPKPDGGGTPPPTGGSGGGDGGTGGGGSSSGGGGGSGGGGSNPPPNGGGGSGGPAPPPVN